MNAEIIAVGRDKEYEHPAYKGIYSFQKELLTLGVFVANTCWVAPELSALFYVVKDAFSRSEIIFILGGLGLGSEDVTRRVLCKGLNLPVEENRLALQNASAFFNSNGQGEAGNFTAYSRVPLGSALFKNPAGPFSGIALSAGSKCVISLPNGPEELFPMLQEYVLPYISRLTSAPVQPKPAETVKPPETKPPPPKPEAVNPPETKPPPPKSAETVKPAETVNPPETKPPPKATPTGAKAEQKPVKAGDSPLLNAIDGCRKKQLGVVFLEFGLGRALCGMLNGIEPSEYVNHYNLDDFSTEAKKSVLGLPEALIREPECYGGEAAVRMAIGAKEIDRSEFGVAVLKAEGGCFTVVVGSGAIVKESLGDLEGERLYGALGAILKRFVNSYPSAPGGSTGLEAFYRQNRPVTIKRKRKEFWQKVLEG